MKSITFESISFDADWIKSKTEEEFLQEAEVNTHWFENDQNRDQKLKQLYAFACLMATPASEPTTDVPVETGEKVNTEGTDGSGGKEE